MCAPRALENVAVRDEGSSRIFFSFLPFFLSLPPLFFRPSSIPLLSSPFLSNPPLSLPFLYPPSLSPPLFSSTQVQSASDKDTIIKCMCTVSGTSGFRLGKQLHRIVPIFLKYTDLSSAGFTEEAKADEDFEADNEDGTNELRASCFAGFESFATRCPVEIESFIPELVKVCSLFMTFDPNYCYDDDEGSGMEDEDGDEEEEEESDNDYSDEEDGDDDSSWKVSFSFSLCCTH